MYVRDGCRRSREIIKGFGDPHGKHGSGKNREDREQHAYGRLFGHVLNGRTWPAYMHTKCLHIYIGSTVCSWKNKFFHSDRIFFCTCRHFFGSCAKALRVRYAMPSSTMYPTVVSMSWSPYLAKFNISAQVRKMPFPRKSPLVAACWPCSTLENLLHERNV